MTSSQEQTREGGEPLGVSWTEPPWIVTYNGPYAFVEAENGQEIFGAAAEGATVVEAQANARIAAAAPELLEALEEVYAYADKVANGAFHHFRDQPCAKKARSILSRIRTAVFAVADKVPEDCDYITAGKEYPVVCDLGAGGFKFVDDEGILLTGLWEGCDHVGNWRRVEKSA